MLPSNFFFLHGSMPINSGSSTNSLSFIIFFLFFSLNLEGRIFSFQCSQCQRAFFMFQFALFLYICIYGLVIRWTNITPILVECSHEASYMENRKHLNANLPNYSKIHTSCGILTISYNNIKR